MTDVGPETSLKTPLGSAQDRDGRVVRNRRSFGPAAARNVGLSGCRTEFNENPAKYVAEYEAKKAKKAK